MNRELKIFTILFDEEMVEFDIKDIENFCFTGKLSVSLRHTESCSTIRAWLKLVAYNPVGYVENPTIRCN